MYGRVIKFAINKNVQQSAIRLRAYPCFFSSVSTHPNNKDRNYVDDIRKSASGMPYGSRSPSGGDDRVNVVKTSTTPSSPTYDDTSSFDADTTKQGVAKAIETGLDIGEMAKSTLDNVWDVAKDTTHKVKEAVTGDDRDNNDVPPTDQFVDNLRKHADGYDLRND